jgi:hypothetical protein
MNKMNKMVKRIVRSYTGLIDILISKCEAMNDGVYHGNCSCIRDPFWSTPQIHPTIVVRNSDEILY